MGYPLLAKWGTPVQTWDGYPPSAGWGTFLSGPGMGYPHPDLGWGTPTISWMGYSPPLSTNVNGQTPVKTLTSRHPSDAGRKNLRGSQVVKARVRYLPFNGIDLWLQLTTNGDRSQSLNDYCGHFWNRIPSLGEGHIPITMFVDKSLVGTLDCANCYLVSVFGSKQLFTASAIKQLSHEEHNAL